MIYNKIMKLDYISTIASVIGSLATACACIISLYQTRLSLKRIIKMRVYPDYVILDGDGVKLNNQKFISFDMINSGNVDVIITDAGYKLSKRHKGVFTVNPYYSSDGIITPWHEHVVTPGRRLSFYFSQENFVEGLNKAFSRKKYYLFYCHDASGNIYYRKIKKTLFFPG